MAIGHPMAVVGELVPPVFVGTIVTPAGSAFEVYGESKAVTRELIDALAKYADGTGSAKSLFFSGSFKLVPAGAKVTPRPMTMDEMGDYFEACERVVLVCTGEGKGDV